jgi:hypothetical protein
MATFIATAVRTSNAIRNSEYKWQMAGKFLHSLDGDNFQALQVQSQVGKSSDA